MEFAKIMDDGVMDMRYCHENDTTRMGELTKAGFLPFVSSKQPKPQVGFVVVEILSICNGKMVQSWETQVDPMAIIGQIVKMGVLDASVSNFKMPNGEAFNIKNEATAPVKMSVRLAGMPEGTFITTTMDVGWNPEIIVEVQATNVEHNLKWGLVVF